MMDYAIELMNLVQKIGNRRLARSLMIPQYDLINRFEPGSPFWPFPLDMK
jgi:hypothetical protein